MLMLCNRCNQTTDARLNKKTNKVICTNCGEEITAITSQTVKALRAMKEYVEEKKQSFSFQCNKCGDRKQGVVLADGSKVVCTVCGEELNVSPLMRQSMKDLGYYQK